MSTLESLKIVELGNTGVGKTTYMASMYGALQQKIGGFSLQSTDLTEHYRLCKIAKSIKKRAYPPRTSEPYKSYNFHLYYQGNKVLPFFWADYRGAALRERKSSDDARHLRNDLLSADGVIIFCDCEKLASGDHQCRSDIRRITSLLTNTFSTIDHPISLAIMFTKADLVYKFQPNLLEPLQGLINTIELSNKISGSIVPVACGEKMTNVEMPLLFALQTGIRFKVDTLKKEIDQHNTVASNHSSQSSNYRIKSNGLGGGIRDLWRKHILELPTYSELSDRESRQANYERNNARKKLKLYQPLVEPVNALDRYLAEIPRIQKGTKLKVYIRQISRIKPEFSQIRTESSQIRTEITRKKTGIFGKLIQWLFKPIQWLFKLIKSLFS